MENGIEFGEAFVMDSCDSIGSICRINCLVSYQ
jgi:hypothetical protein